MRTRTKWFVVAGISLTGMIACLYFSGTPQPEYQGRKLDAWLADLASQNYQTQQVARVAFREMGPAAVPFLTNSLAQRAALSIRIHRKRLLPKRVVNWARKVVKWQTPAMESRNAAIALQALGTQATNAIPQLVAALADPSLTVAQSAAAALGAMGTNAVPALIERFPKANTQELFWMLQALGAMGTNAGPLKPSTLYLSPTNSVREVVSNALALFTPSPVQK
jgi:HEAT repeat protein